MNINEKVIQLWHIPPWVWSFTVSAKHGIKSTREIYSFIITVLAMAYNVFIIIEVVQSPSREWSACMGKLVWQFEYRWESVTSCAVFHTHLPSYSIMFSKSWDCSSLSHWKPKMRLSSSKFTKVFYVPFRQLRFGRHWDACLSSTDRLAVIREPVAAVAATKGDKDVRQ